MGLLHQGNVAVKDISKDMLQPFLGAMAMKLHHAWAGHAARFPSQHPCSLLLHWRHSAWWKEELNKRHSDTIRMCTAHLPTLWEGRLTSCHGLFWTQMAQSRCEWETLELGVIAERQWEVSMPITHSPQTHIVMGSCTANYF